MKKRITALAILVLISILHLTGLSKSQDTPSTLAEAPHYTSEITIKPNPELEATFKCNVKLTNLETGEDISGPELILVKGMEGTAGTAHDWLNLDTFLKATSDKESKAVTYSLDIYYKGTKIGNNTGNITLE